MDVRGNMMYKVIDILGQLCGGYALIEGVLMAIKFFVS